MNKKQKKFINIIFFPIYFPLAIIMTFITVTLKWIMNDLSWMETLNIKQFGFFTMEEYCVDLEIAKEMKKNGFSQKTCFVYEYDSGNNHNIIMDIDQQYSLFDTVSAPTSDEIIKELPKTMMIWHENDCYAISATTISVHQERNKKLSNILGKMWLYLKKEGHIK